MSNFTSSVKWTGTTWLLRRPAVGEESLGSDSGMAPGVPGPGQPTHTPRL